MLTILNAFYHFREAFSFMCKLPISDLLSVPRENCEFCLLEKSNCVNMTKLFESKYYPDVT